MLTFTGTFFKEFIAQDTQDLHLRVGQRFHHFAKLEKVTNKEDKRWCDRLYELDKSEAVAFLFERIDFSQ